MTEHVGEQSGSDSEEEDGDGDADIAALEHQEDGSKMVDVEGEISSSGLPERWDVLGLGQAMVIPPFFSPL